MKNIYEALKQLIQVWRLKANTYTKLDKITGSTENRQRSDALREAANDLQQTIDDNPRKVWTKKGKKSRVSTRRRKA